MSLPRVLRVAFCDMWGHGEYQFHPFTSYFYKLLSLYYTVEVADDDVDVLFFSCFGDKHKEIAATTKIYICGENISAPGSDRKIEPEHVSCDLSLSQFPQSNTNYYFPLWVLFVNWFYEKIPLSLPSNPTYLTHPDDLITTRCTFDSEKLHDCCFMNNNPMQDRVELYKSLSARIMVKSYGKLFNNVGYLLRGHEGDKCEILKSHRLTISYENSYRHGYNTEKIIHPYSVGSIGIYSGGLDRTIFNSRALFFNEDYESQEHMIDDIVECLANPLYFRTKIAEPLFIDNRLPSRFKPASVLSWLRERI